MQNFNSCQKCNNNFFIEHENAAVIENVSSNQVMASDSFIGYKIIECVFCRTLYFSKQYKKGQMEKIVQIDQLSPDDIREFKQRNDLRGKEKFGEEVLSAMLRK